MQWPKKKKRAFHNNFLLTACCSRPFSPWFVGLLKATDPRDVWVVQLDLRIMLLAFASGNSRHKTATPERALFSR
jgi:hypothetical protein